MSAFEIFYLVVSILAALLCAGIGLYVVVKRQTIGVVPFAIMMFSISIWIVFMLLSLRATTVEQIIFWLNIRFFLVSFVPYIWLIYSIHFYLQTNKLSHKVILSLGIIPFITQIVVWTNPFHHWLFVSYHLDQFGSFQSVATWNWGWWFWVHVIYSAIIILVGSILVIQSAASKLQLYRGQSILLLLSLALPVLIKYLYTLDLLPTDLDFTPIAFSFTGIILFINIQKFQFTNLIPIGKEKLIEYMRDGMIIISQKYEVLDINPAALNNLKTNLPTILGSNLFEIFPFFPYPDLEVREIYDIKPRIGNETKHFEVISSPFSRDAFLTGWILIIRDSTEKTLVETAYKDIERRFNKVIMHSHEGIVIIDNTGKIIIWNKAIENLLDTSRTEMIGRYVWDIIPFFTKINNLPSDNLVQVENEIRQGLITGKSSLFNKPLEIRLLSKNNQMYYAEFIIYSIKAGNGYYICFSEHDITDQIEARRALQKSYDTLEQQVKERTTDLENLMDTLEQRIQDRTKDLSILYQISATANQISNLEEMLQTCLELILNALNANSGTIHLYNADSNKLSLIAHVNLGQEFLSSIQSIPATWNIFGRVIEEGHTITSLDLSHEDCRQIHFPSAKPGDTISYTGNLMKAKDRKVGVLSIFQPSSQHFSVEQVALLTTISEQLGVVIENHELHRNAESLAVMEERQRLARDLHDSVTQRLYSLMLYASAGKKANLNQNTAKVSNHLEQIDLNAQQALREMRLLINELRPDVLEKEGFIGAIRHRLDFVERRAGVDYELEISGKLDLTHKEEAELFNILTEALNNALKHANASKIIITLQSENNYFLMRILDNGTGFDITAKEQPTGFGIISMRERAKKIGGTLTIQSALNSHTSIMVELGNPTEPSIPSNF
jgi:two-component system NarL family sensor kinase